ncbi:MAG: TolC family protein [Bryobacterales bacterium]|nr:TolC family protein [Bryobacterales bacterium]
MSPSRLKTGLAVVLISSAALRAQSPDASLAELLQEALRSSPEIAAAQKRFEASKQRPTQASSLPDPMFSPGFNSNGRPWPGAGLGTEPTSNIGFMVSQEVPFPGKRKLAGDMAVKESEAEWQQYQQVQLNIVSRVKQAYFRRAYAFAAADVLARNLELLRKFLAITEARYSVGRAQQQDIFKAQTQISILETKRVQIEREKGAREAELNSLVNRSPGSKLAPPSPLKPIALPATLAELTAAAQKNNPMLRRDEKMIQRAEVAVNAARREYYPDVTINGGYYNMGRMPDMYMLRADLKVPLYFFRKQRAAVTEQSQTLAQTRRSFESTNQSLLFRIQDDFLMAQTASQLVELYSKTVIPQAGLALESSLSSYETGAVDFLSVYMNYITIVEYEMNYYEELQNMYLALVRLEEMTAQQLVQ